MGQVVPFIARLRDSGDWTAVERARLQELADRLASNGVHVEVIFGATDEGDPWCVVTDEGGDVLIHVARIDGKFVVHSAVDDAVNENVDLHSALRDSLVATEEAAAPRSATILPFGLSARQGQTFLALLAATTFFYETASIGDAAEAAEPVHALPEQDPPPPPADADEAAQDRETVAQGVALQPSAATAATTVAAGPVAASAEANAPAPEDGGPVAPEPPAEVLVAAAPGPKAEASAPAPEPEFKLIEGSSGDDLLVGTAADEHIVGGDGNDTLIGGGGRDLLEGGAGDDVIHITGQSVALGGSGADTFLIQAPVQMGRAETLLGVIADFNRGEGDRIFNWAGENVRLTPHRTPGVDDKGAPPVTPGLGGGDVTTLSPPTNGRDGYGDFGTAGGNGPSTLGPSTLGPTSGSGHTLLTRVDVDLDGDGVVDGYLLVPPLDGAKLDADSVSTSGRLGQLTRFDVDLDGDGVADGFIVVGPRGISEMSLASVGVAFSHTDPFA